MKKRNKIGFFLLFIFIAVFIILFLSVVYNQRERSTQSESLLKPRLYHRNIHTEAKKWLNGYLGIFFRFRYFGNINWLAVPLFIYFLWTVKRRERWQCALMAIYLISTIVLCIKGYTNWRYQFTLFPFTVSFILIFGWEILKDRGKYLKVFIFSFTLILVSYNFYRYSENNHKHQWNIMKQIINKPYPNEVLEFIDSFEFSKAFAPKFLICDNTDMFYYYSDYNAIHWQNPKYKLGGSRDKLYKLLKEGHKITHIYARRRFLNDRKRTSLAEVIHLDCQRIAVDKDYRLYKLREEPLEEILKTKVFFEYKVWPLEEEDLVKEVDSSGNITFSLRVQGIRGKFRVETKKIDGEDTLVLRNLEKGKNGKRILQIGFSLEREFIEKHSLFSKHAYFLVNISIPKHLINRKNFIFIQDFDGKWNRNKVYFSRDSWRNYVVKKKIKHKSQKSGIGLRIEPQSPKDEILIKDIKIYFLKEKI